MKLEEATVKAEETERKLTAEKSAAEDMAKKLEEAIVITEEKANNVLEAARESTKNLQKASTDNCVLRSQIEASRQEHEEELNAVRAQTKKAVKRALRELSKHVSAENTKAKNAMETQQADLEAKLSVLKNRLITITKEVEVLKEKLVTDRLRQEEEIELYKSLSDQYKKCAEERSQVN